MHTVRNITKLLIMGGIFLTSCEAFLEPDPANFFSEEDVMKTMFYAEGLLLNGYTKISTNTFLYPVNDVATDDAVSNQNGNQYRRMAEGEWSSQFNPISLWSSNYSAIYYMNYFLHDVVDKVEWSWSSTELNENYRRRFTGEAYGLRAWHNFELLRRHAGKAVGGSMLGHVLINEPITKDMEWDFPRSTFEECVKSIYNDIESAMPLVPMDYGDIGVGNYDKAFGERYTDKISKRILMALKSRVALFVASPAFLPTTSNWEYAADAAAALLVDIGGVSGLSPTGNKWYQDGSDPEIIWRRIIDNRNNWERDNFPPSLYGTGRVDPTQNLVDAFPMKNGYPISHPESGYDPDNPYEFRDNRLNDYIVYNGSQLSGKMIYTGVNSTPDGLNQSVNATRTGYYLRKLMHEGVNLAPNVNTIQPHFSTLIRYTEIFLNYAEAANEVWGPYADPKGYGFTPVSIISAIRNRAGIYPDNYLSSITTKEEMRELIRNERRIELCFEGFRFFDLRRWGIDLTEKAKGMRIEPNSDPDKPYRYTIVDVESRLYKPYMKYGPLPYSELLKNKNLIQNEGW